MVKNLSDYSDLEVKKIGNDLSTNLEVIPKNNFDRFDLTDKLESVAKRILEKYYEAFEELAK